MGQKFLFVLAFLACASYGLSQEATFGVRAGLNFAKWNVDFGNDAKKARVGVLFGGNVEVPVKDNISVQADILFAMMGGKFNDAYETAVYKTSYLLLPVVGKYNFKNGISVVFGPQLGMLLSANYDIDGDEGNIKEAMKAMDLFLVLGAEYHLQQGIAVGIRFHHGIMNVENGASTNINNRSFSLEATYMLPNL